MNANHRHLPYRQWKMSLLSAEVESRRKYTIKKAASFHFLMAGWYFERGSSISNDAIENSINFVKLAASNELWQSNVFPREEGGVQVELYAGEHEVEIAIEPNGISAITYDFEGDQRFEAEGLSFLEAMSTLRTIAKKICTSEQFTRNTLTSTNIDSVLSHASLQAMVASQSSSSNVAKSIQARSASISENFTKISPQSRQFFGKSPQPIYP
ncbi:MAG: hypothetical protein EPN62_20045 [Candidimonas sp.]|nr:MAG: hypothetical protein EPN62_20045 [Candidimonas sp.]